MKPWLLLLLLVPICLQAAILHVAIDGSQLYLAIQTAVNASAPNDTILVHPGTYFANVEIYQKSLTLASLEMITGDSTYIAQTIINGNQTGSCIRVIESDSVIVRGLYLTNGNGSLASTGITTKGGGIYVRYSKSNIVNCRIWYNSAYGGAGCTSESSILFLSGTTIAFNHGITKGALDYFGIPDSHDTRLLFDPVNRCSIYNNFATWGNDICLGNAADTVHIYLDKFTVSPADSDIGEYIYSQINHEFSPYTLDYNVAVIVSQFSDLYVSPVGDDNNNGLSSATPLKTIALALLRIKADSLNQQTIFLANGVYSPSLNGQFFPLNLKSYVTIQGESTEGTILDGDNIYGAFGGYNSEQKIKICNITLQHFAMPPSSGYSIIWCISRYRNVDGNLRLLSMELDKITIRDCHPIFQDKIFSLIEIVYPQRLKLTNILIENCSGSKAISLDGSNIIGENICIRSFHYTPNSVNVGTALVVSQNNFYYGNRPNVFTNLEITNCHNNQTEWGTSNVLSISGCYAYTSENIFINTTIADNVCSPNIGSAVLLSSYTNVNFVNSIISNNYPYNVKFNISNLSEPCRLRLMNTLLYTCPTGNGSIYNSNPDNTIEYYGICLDTIPDFTNNPNNPYYLNQTSPCIDAGTTNLTMFTLPTDFVFPLLDLAGNPRIYGSQIDLGAYEWNGTANQDEHIPFSETHTLSIYPNPFVNNTNIGFVLPEKGDVKLDIYNTKGQKVRALLNDFRQKGYNNIFWNGRDENGKIVSSGMYFARIEQAGKVRTGKMLMLN